MDGIAYKDGISVRRQSPLTHPQNTSLDEANVLTSTPRRLIAQDHRQMDW